MRSERPAPPPLGTLTIDTSSGHAYRYGRRGWRRIPLWVLALIERRRRD